MIRLTKKLIKIVFLVSTLSSLTVYVSLSLRHIHHRQNKINDLLFIIRGYGLENRKPTSTPSPYYDFQAFSSICNENKLYEIEFSKRFHNVTIPVESSQETSCPRLIQLANYSTIHTGLLSYPGSGNTWMRHLLQQMTGLGTGSTCAVDHRLRTNGFPFEGKRKNVIAIKTHGIVEVRFSGYIPTKNFSRLIVLLRNPYDSILAEYKRLLTNGNHTGNIYVNATSETWKKRFPELVKNWRNFIKDTFAFSGPKIVIFYEDLKTQLLQELIRLALFIKSDKLSDFALCCVVKHQEGNFRRPPSKQTNQDIFSNKDEVSKVNEILLDSASLLQKQYPEVSTKLKGFVRTII